MTEQEEREQLALQIDPGCDLDRAIPLIEAHDAALAARIFEQCAKVCRERGEAKKQDFRTVPGIGAHAAKAEALGCEAEIRELSAKFAAGAPAQTKCIYSAGKRFDCPIHGAKAAAVRLEAWSDYRFTDLYAVERSMTVLRRLCQSYEKRLETLEAFKVQQLLKGDYDNIKCDYGDECPGHASPDERPCGWEPPAAQLFRFSFKRSPEHVDAVLFEGKPGEELFRHEGGELKVRDGASIAPDEMVAPDGRVVRQGDVLTARAGVLLINGEGPARAMDLELWLERMWKITDGDMTLEAVGPVCIDQGLRWLHDRAEDTAFEKVLDEEKKKSMPSSLFKDRVIRRGDTVAIRDGVLYINGKGP